MTTTAPTPTTATSTTTAPARSTRSVRQLRRLRLLLTVDAATCAVSGLVGLAVARATAHQLGLATATPMVAVAAFLVAYASVLAVLGRSTERVARTGAAVTAAGDAAWVLATAGLVAAGTFSGLGTAVAVAVALVVATLGIEKALALR